MAFDTWAPLAVPQLGSGFSDDERVLEAQFGDGYAQTLDDGLNAQFTSGELVWNGITSTELADLQSFWADHGKSVPFRWTVPGESVPKLFVFTAPLARAQFRRDANGARFYSTSTQIKQRFDLG